MVLVPPPNPLPPCIVAAGVAPSRYGLRSGYDSYRPYDIISCFSGHVSLLGEGGPSRNSLTFGLASPEPMVYSRPRVVTHPLHPAHRGAPWGLALWFRHRVRSAGPLLAIRV